MLSAVKWSCVERPSTFRERLMYLSVDPVSFQTDGDYMLLE